MSRFVIEVTQPSGSLAHRRLDSAVRGMGSHFVTHAAWKQENGKCTGTMIVEADDMSDVIGIVPPSLRSLAQVYRLELAAAA
jgi:hypothetical protein